MADPEGVEEDLFADLYGLLFLRHCLLLTDVRTPRYDADESSAAQAAAPAAEPPKPSVSAPSATPQSTGFVAQSVENPQFDTDSLQNVPQAFHHDFSQGYGVGQPDFQGAGNAMPTAPEPEPQGTGIKEDG